MRKMATRNTPQRRTETKQGEGGGAAVGGGVAFQARCSAWFPAYVLAKQDAEPPFGLTSASSRIGCEATEEVDDILVRIDSRNVQHLSTKSTTCASNLNASQFRRAVEDLLCKILGVAVEVGEAESCVHFDAFDYRGSLATA
jgi:hypothetical protein